MRPVVAVDLGGTNIRAAYYPRGTPPAVRSSRRATGAGDGPTAVLERIHAAIEDLALSAPEAEAMIIGIGAPGPLDPATGVVHHAPNLPGWHEVPLGEMLSRRWGCPVKVENDANLAALGEWGHGSGRGAHHLILLTIGTGIGGGVIVDDRLVRGWRGLGGELGHLPLVADGPRCSCGQAGHLEAIASGTAIARAYRQVGGGPADGPAITTERIAAAARAGDPRAKAVFNDAADAIGRGLSGLVHVFNPERVLLGGGVVRAGEWFTGHVERALRESLMDATFGEGLQVLPAELGDEAALLGALTLVTSDA